MPLVLPVYWKVNGDSLLHRQLLSGRSEAERSLVYYSYHCISLYYMSNVNTQS